MVAVGIWFQNCDIRIHGYSGEHGIGIVKSVTGIAVWKETVSESCNMLLPWLQSIIVGKLQVLCYRGRKVVVGIVKLFCRCENLDTASVHGKWYVVEKR